MSDPASSMLMLRVLITVGIVPSLKSMKSFSPQTCKSDCSVFLFVHVVDICCNKRYYTLCLTVLVL
jgi:hypothetical protein